MIQDGYKLTISGQRANQEKVPLRLQHRCTGTGIKQRAMIAYGADIVYIEFDLSISACSGKRYRTSW